MPHEPHLGSAPNPPPPPGQGTGTASPGLSLLPTPSPKAGRKLSWSPLTLQGGGRSLPMISFQVLQDVHSSQGWEDQACTLAFRLLGFPG